MAKYNPPVVNLPIFDPNDFNTTLVKGYAKTVTDIANTIITEQAQLDVITTKMNLLYDINNTNGNSNRILYFGYGTTSPVAYPCNTVNSFGLNLSKGVFLIAFSMAATFTSNLDNTPIGTVLPSYSGIIGTNYEQINVNCVQYQSQKSFDLGGTFIVSAPVDNTNASLVFCVNTGSTTTTNTVYINGDINNGAGVIPGYGGFAVSIIKLSSTP
jgi:hypothetical protein